MWEPLLPFRHHCDHDRGPNGRSDACVGTSSTPIHANPIRYKSEQSYVAPNFRHAVMSEQANISAGIATGYRGNEISTAIWSDVLVSDIATLLLLDQIMDAWKLGPAALDDHMC